MRPQSRSNEPRVNERIRAPELRVISDDGQMLGVLSPRDALKLARERGLDLVEVSPAAQPPVAKIMDYGKFKYLASKKAKPKATPTKELQLRPNIDDHDFRVKLERAKRFLMEGDPVQVVISFKGRENAHRDLGQALANRLLSELGGFYRLDKPAGLEGNRLTMTLQPSKLAKATPAAAVIAHTVEPAAQHPALG